MKSVDIVSILTIVAGLVGTGMLSAFGASIDAWAPGWGTKTVAVLSSVSLGAGLVLRIVQNKTGAPAPSIIADAPVLPKGTAVTPPTSVDHPTVLSTTSNLLPDQAKGTLL